MIDAAQRLGPPRTAASARAVLSESATFFLPLAGAGLATWLAYRRLAPDVQTFSAQWGAPPPTSLAYLPEIFSTYSGRALRCFCPPDCSWRGFGRRRRRANPCCRFACSWGCRRSWFRSRGVSHFPWAYGRFQIYCVPLMLILMAEGIQWLAYRFTAWRAPGVAWALVASMGVAWLPALEGFFAGKHANAVYGQVAAYLQSERRAGDVVVAEGAAQLELVPLLPPGADGAIPAEEFVKNPARVPEGGTRVLRRPGALELGTPAARRAFGKLQVLVYAGPVTAVLAGLRADLVRVANGRVDPALADPYTLLALLDESRPADPAAPTPREWRLLARLCRTQTARFRSMPEQMRERANAPGKRRRAPAAEPDQADDPSGTP